MKYKNNTKQTKEYMNTIEQYLVNKYGCVSPEWSGIMQLLADNFDLYTECRQSIRENGIFDSNTGKKNPLLATIKDLQATIIKEIQHLGISPYAASKIGSLAQEGDDSELLKKLVGQDDEEVL